MLTAAHCDNNSYNSVFVGAFNLNNSPGRQVGISRKVKHPNYNSNTLVNDFMLLFLDESLTDIPVVPINGNNNSPDDGELLTVIGTGATSEGGNGSAQLKEVDVPVVSQSTCNSNYGGGIVESVMFCAGVPEGGKDSCQGDSGGPIMTQSGVQVGVVSWGSGCARPGLPGVYARISGVYNWIVNEACPGSAPFCGGGGPSPTPSPVQNPPTQPPAGSCSDDPNWYYDRSDKDCGWVAVRPSRRCNRVGFDGRDGNEACPETCGTPCDTGSSPTPAPGPSTCSGGSFALTLETDSWGEETSWNVKEDGSTRVLASGGPYGDERTFNENACLADTSACYVLTVNDSYGDGLVSGSGYVARYNGAIFASVPSSDSRGWSTQTHKFGNCGSNPPPTPSPPPRPTPSPTDAPTDPPSCSDLRVDLRTDDSPKETSFYLYKDGDDVWSDKGYGFQPNRQYTEEEKCLDLNSCWRFIIFDVASNGIDGSGLTLSVDGRTVYSGGNFRQKYEYELGNC